MTPAVVDPPAAPAPVADASTPATPPVAAAPPVASAPEAKPASAAPAYEFKGVDGTPADAAYAKELATLAADLKVDPKDGGKLYQHVQSRLAANAKQGEAAWNETLGNAEKVSRADALIGGADYDAKTANYKLMVEKFSHKDYPIWPDIVTLGLDRSPGVRHFLRTLFEGQREPNSIVTGGAPSGPAKSVTDLFFSESMGPTKE